MAEQGSARAQFRVAYMYDVGEGVAKNSEQAVRWYRAAAAQGEVAAQYNLGLMLANGEGVAKDNEEAAKWYRLAANHGDPMAQYRLGQLYFSGGGVPMDYAEWLKWLRASARQGYLAAQKQLGFWLDKGCRWKREPKWDVDSKDHRLNCDSEEAAKWYQLAAERGDTESQRDLGQMCLEGRGVPQSDTEALKWLRMAADQGEADAQLNLARMYKDGRAVPQDYVQAHMWANLAASRALTGVSGLSPDDLSDMRRYYTVLRDQLAAMMTPEQLAQAQALARNWKPTKSNADPDGQLPKESSPPLAEEEVLAGSGFLVDRLGTVVTNYHVVDGCTQIEVFSSAGEQKVGVIAADGRNDLAAIGPIKQAASSLAFSGQRPELGQNVIAVGYPLQGILLSSVNVTTGTVSALAGLHDDSRMIQITAPVQPGNSGGPLLDQGGAVVGIVTSKLDALRTAELVGDVPQNVNFAIREATVRAFLDANGVEYAIQPPNASLDTVAVADRARKAVVRIECRK